MCAKIDRVRQNFADMQAQLICPICGGNLQLSANSFTCPARHCFDLAAANYLNLAPGKSSPKGAHLYDEQLFSTRRRVFEAGFYDDICHAIADIAATAKARTGLPLTVVDAGAGEGFFARRLLADLTKAGIKSEILALDLAKPGVVMAAKTEPTLKCLLADLAQLPLADNSVDIILNVLSPANYSEFRRVLAPGGLLIKVIPGADYLQQVRTAYGIAAREENEAAALFAALSSVKTEQRICRNLPVTPAQAADFLQMTPLSDHRTPPAADFDEITIDLSVLTAQY